MRRVLATNTTMPESGELNQTKQVSSPSLSLVGRFASIRQKLEEGSQDTDKGDLDKLAAPWLDAALSRHPNLKDLEADIGCTKAYVSQLRNGHVAAPLRVLVPLLAHPNCIHEFTNQMRVAAGLPIAPARQEIQREDVLEVALAMLLEGPLRRSLLRECEERYGVTSAQVVDALQHK